MRFFAMRRCERHTTHSLRSSSPFVNIQVRVMCRTSVSRLMSGGNAANGADISTIFTAAASSTRLPRRAVDLDVLDAAVAADRHRQQQAAVELERARRLGIVEVADALDLGPPVLDVAREPVFLGARADEAALRPLLVDLDVLRDARLDAASPRACAASARSPTAGPRARGASTGFGIAGAVGALLMRVISSRASCSSTSSRCAATAISPRRRSPSAAPAAASSRARFASVLPPPSRLACARMSASAGLAFDFALTSATSSGGVRSVTRFGIERPEPDREQHGVDHDRGAERVDDEAGRRAGEIRHAERHGRMRRERGATVSAASRVARRASQRCRLPGGPAAPESMRWARWIGAAMCGSAWKCRSLAQPRGVWDHDRHQSGRPPLPA